MPKFCLNTDNGREHVKANLVAFIDRLPVDKAWQVTIEPLKKDRTPPQNKALFGVAYAELQEQTGNDKEDMHWYMCGEFFGWTEKDTFGKIQKVPMRTTTTGYDGKRDIIKTKEFAEFYNFVQRRAAENGFYVSDPDPLWSIGQ